VPILAVVSDLHCGSTVGLCPSTGVELDDGSHYTPSDAQVWLWDRWVEYWWEVERIAAGRDIYVLINGDATEGDHHGTYQIISRNPGTELLVADLCLSVPMRLRPAGVVIVRGTEAHVGKGASLEELMARQLQAQGSTIIPADGRRLTHWHWQGEIGGVLVDAAHHGRMGTRPWTKSNAVLGLAAEIWMHHAQGGRRAPDLAFRSHYHQLGDSHDAFPTRVIQTPAWQLATSYVHRVAPGALSDVGGIICDLEDGRANVTKWRARPSPTPIWRAP
jgi:hypothetical protein